MESDTQTKQCTNCLNMFPGDRIDLHEAYCCRNIRRCKLCNKMVDIKDQEDHDKEFHSKKICIHCSGEFMPDTILNHQDTCPRKPTICQYCQNIFAYVQHPQHQDVCGARTKPCTLCQRPIMLRDYVAHEGRCQRRERAQVSQDQYRNRRNGEQRNPGQRQRQISTNNIREGVNKSTSIQKINRPHKVKPANIIGPQLIKPAIDTVPVSIRLAMKAKQQRLPLKTKN